MEEVKRRSEEVNRSGAAMRMGRRSKEVMRRSRRSSEEEQQE